MPRERRAPPSEDAPFTRDGNTPNAGMDALRAIRDLAKILACQAAQEDDAEEVHGSNSEEQVRAICRNP